MGAIPGNSEYSVAQLRMLLKEVELIAGKDKAQSTGGNLAQNVLNKSTGFCRGGAQFRKNGMGVKRRI